MNHVVLLKVVQRLSLEPWQLRLWLSPVQQARL
jgi:hypothetical protein